VKIVRLAMNAERLFAIASVAALVAAAPASASFPGKNGRIFFSSVRQDGSLEVFSMRADGSSVSRLTLPENSGR
jgi:hypothetical protein